MGPRAYNWVAYSAARRQFTGASEFAENTARYRDEIFSPGQHTELRMSADISPRSKQVLFWLLTRYAPIFSISMRIHRFIFLEVALAVVTIARTNAAKSHSSS